MKKNRLFYFVLLIVLIIISVPTIFYFQNKEQEEIPNETGIRPITIKWVGQGDYPVDESSPVVKEMEKILDCDLQFVFISRAQFYDVLDMLIASKDIPDVFYLNDSYFQSYIQQGILSDIPEDLLKKTAPTLYELILKNGSDKAWNYAKHNSDIYGIPILNPVSEYHFVPIWRSDWLENIGIKKIPSTLAEAENAFYKFANDDPDQDGANDTYALSDKGMSAVFGAYGGIPFQSKGGNGSYTWSVDGNGTVIATPVMPEMKDALALLHKWYADGLIDPEFVTEESKGEYWANSIPFWNGTIGFSVPGQYYHIKQTANKGPEGGTWYSNFIKFQPAGSYIEGKPLTGSKGKSGLEKWNRFTAAYFVISSNAKKEPGKLEKILSINEKLVSDFDFKLLTYYGIKDIHYKITDGVYTDIPPYNTPELKGRLGLVSQSIGMLGGSNYEFNKKLANPIIIEYVDKFAKIAGEYENAVWTGLPSDIRYKSVVERKLREGYILFITGERDLGEFDRFVEECNKSGLDQLTREANEWYSKVKNQ